MSEEQIAPVSPLRDPIKKRSAPDKLTAAMLDTMREMKNYWIGRVKTIIDASIADHEQRKALKDLVNDAFWSKEYYSDDFVRIAYQFTARYAPEQMFKTSDKDKEFWEFYGLNPAYESGFEAADSRPLLRRWFTD